MHKSGIRCGKGGIEMRKWRYKCARKRNKSCYLKRHKLECAVKAEAEGALIVRQGRSRTGVGRKVRRGRRSRIVIRIRNRINVRIRSRIRSRSRNGNGIKTGSKGRSGCRAESM